jgi:hypothetical protein
MSFTLYNKFVEIYTIVPWKTSYCIKRQKFQKKFEKFAIYGLHRYGAGTGTGTFQK